MGKLNIDKTTIIRYNTYMDKELYNIMKDVYRKYTGEQVALVVAQIRKEIELERTTRDVREKIIDLTEHLKQLESTK